MINPASLVATITAVSIILADGRDVDEINLLSVILVQLGDTLSTIATQKDFIEDLNEKARKANKDSEDNNK